MTRRGIETILAGSTLVVLVLYVPLETWFSWPGGLLDPYYLIDAIAMVLLLWGAVHSLGARPRPSPELLCIGCAWASANGWRATFDRLREIQSGGSLTYGSREMWTVGTATALGVAVFAILLVLVALNRRHELDARRAARLLP
jgi:hypothetical protein